MTLLGIMSYCILMNEIDYLKHFEQLLGEIKRLRDERDALNFTLLRLTSLVKVTASMFPEAGRDVREATEGFIKRLNKESVGLTEAVHMVLRNSPGEKFTPPMIRKELERNNFPFADYRSNPLASINSTLKRLHAYGSLMLFPGSKGKPIYQWRMVGTRELLKMLKANK